MLITSRKKAVLAAAVAALAVPSLSQAAQITLPYSTNFPAAPAVDTAGNSYNNGTLQGQAPGSGAGSLNGSAGWVNENGEQNDTATVSVGSGVTLTSTFHTPGGTPANPDPVWSDVYDSNLADHPNGLYPPGSGPTGNSNGNGVALNAATYGNKLTISYNLDVLAATGSQTPTFSSTSDFGMRILDSSDNLLASLFVKADPSVNGQENIYVQTGADAAQVIPNLVGPANGTTGNYAIALDLQHGDFNVFVNGVESADIPFASSETGVTSIGAVAFSSDNLGAGNQGVFSSLSVVPEPAGIAMIGLGGLALLFRRSKREA
jgi:hypothetical protein